MPTSTTTARKTPARRPAAPQDRKAKAVKAKPAHVKGWELLKPLSDIPVWDQTELFDSLLEIIAEHEAGNVSETRFVGVIAKRLMDFAVDKDAYLAFVSGPQAITNAAPLVMTWIDQMGELKPSDS